ncbi:MAG: S8 family serine peptidase [Firmicutes bacterium]|nr:S8 family serine peptidase [Bacillota bacterium]
MYSGNTWYKKIAFVLLVSLLVGLGTFSPLSAQAAPEPGSELLSRFEGYDLTSSENITVIVELEDEPVVRQRANLQAQGMFVTAAQEKSHEILLQAQQQTALMGMRQLGLSSKLHFGYTKIFNGMAIELPANQVAQLEAISGVKAVYPDEVYYEDVENSLPTIDAPSAWELPPGYDGSGIVVGVIDGWVDWMHPEFGEGIGPGYRVIGGWDFILNQPLEESVNIGVDGRHGTHVAATVAATAPGASIRNYRVLWGGSGTLARILAAMEMAVRDKVDVVSMSIGSTYGHPDTPRARAIDNVVLAGIVFVCSNGNNGPVERTTGGYAQSQLAISVGNADARMKQFFSHGTGQTHLARLFTYSPQLDELEGQTFEYVDCGYGGYLSDFYEDGIVEEGRSLVEGKVALVSRGGPSGATSFYLKHDNARDAGAVAVIVYNNVPDGVVSGTIYNDGDIPIIGSSQADGQLLKAQSNKTIEFSNDSYVVMNNGSSRGPTSMLDIKPDVSAPGTVVIAAVPFPAEGEEPVSGATQRENGGWYANLSGTSMATPQVAGAAAILRQAYPHWTPEQVKLALMNTAVDIKQENGQSYRPIDQGAGLINVMRALKTQLFIKPGSLSFRDAAVEELTKNVTLESISNETNSYEIRVAMHNPENQYRILLADEVELKAGETKTLPITLEIDPTLPPSVLGESEYCGYIYFINKNNPDDYYRLPYHFVYQQPVSQFTVAPDYMSLNPEATQRTVTFTYTLGSDVHDVRFRVHGLSNSYFGYTGPLAAGTYSFEWDGTVDDENVTISDGYITIYPQYQLYEGGPWVNMTNTGNQGAMAYARIMVHSLPPKFVDVTPVISDVEGHVIVQGFVDDALFALLDLGGDVRLNGEKLVVTSHAVLPPPGESGLGYDLGIFASDPIPVDLKKGINFRLEATDVAGNATTQDFEFKAVTLDNPRVHRVLPGPYTVSGRAIPGVEVRINGEVIPLAEDGTFSWDTEVVGMGNQKVDITAHIPQWKNFKPLKIDFNLIGVPNENATGQVD